MKHGIVVSIYLTIASITYLQENVEGNIRVTYFEIDPTFATKGEYNVCPQVEIQITTCQMIEGKFEPLCRGPGGYQTDLTGPPTINDPDVTICCSGQGPGESYVNASEFGRYLNGTEVEFLTTIGCDLSGGENRFITLKKFRKLEAKALDGTVQVKIDVTDTITTNWIEAVVSTVSGDSDLGVDRRIFKHNTNDGNRIKSFSFIDTSGAGRLETVTYFGT